MQKETITNIIKGCSVILIYFIFSLFNTLPLALLNIDFNSLPIIVREIYNISLEVIMIVIFIIIFKDTFKKAFQDIKKNHFTYFKKYLKFYLFGLVIMMLCNSLIMILGGSTSDNETAVRSQFEMYPVYIFICSVILAPIIEETTFRLGFRKIFKNNYLFIIISGLVFGSLHLTGMFNDPLILLYLGAYSALGFVFAYMLAKTDNIFVSMGFHFMHNGILMSIQFLALLIA